MRHMFNQQSETFSLFFDSPKELISSLSREGIEQMKRDLRWRSRWFGVKDLSELLKNINGGDERLVAAYKKASATLKAPPKSRVKKTRAYGDGGAQFHIQKYLNGDEAFMSRLKPQEEQRGNSRAKVANVLVNIGENANVKASQMFQKALTATTVIRAYQARNIPTRLTVTLVGRNSVEIGRNRYNLTMSVQVKKPNDPLVAAATLPFLTPYFFRSMMAVSIKSLPLFPSINWLTLYPQLASAPLVAEDVGSASSIRSLEMQDKSFIGADDSSIVIDVGQCLNKTTSEYTLEKLGIVERN